MTIASLVIILKSKNANLHFVVKKLYILKTLKKVGGPTLNYLSGLVSLALAAASRAIGTLKGLQET